MAKIQTRNSLMAVVAETIEGVPVAPSAGTDYVPIREGADLVLAFDKIDTDELKSSLGPGKPITGLENPTGEIPIYLKHSGTEGQAPAAVKAFYKAVFGSEVVASTEYDTIIGSDVSTVIVDSGEGTNFQRGQALLVKKSTGVGYEIRPVHSVSTDDLNLGFQLQDAPGVGVNLGKSILYKPADSGHQSLTLWQYLGNGGAVKAISGARVTELGIEINAGEPVGASISVEGLKNYFNPITTSATKYQVQFTDDDLTDEVVAVVQQTWQDPHQLADAIETAMNATATTEVHTVVYSDTTGKFTFTNTTGSTLALDFAGGSNQIATVIGFAASDLTGATTYTSASAVSFAAPQSASFDDSDILEAKDNLVMIGDSDDYLCFPAGSVTFTLATPKRDINTICSSSGRSGSIINSREVTISVNATLDQYDVDKFRRLRENSDTRFCYVGGKKTGGNWVAGKCFCIYVPTAVINSVETPDDDGLLALNLELKAYVDASGNGEVYLNFI